MPAALPGDLQPRDHRRPHRGNLGEHAPGKRHPDLGSRSACIRRVCRHLMEHQRNQPSQLFARALQDAGRE